MSEPVSREKFLEAVGLHRPRRAIVLGSGMAGAMDHAREICSISWADWPGIPVRPGIGGHSGKLTLRVNDQGWPCLVAGGRLHRYEGHSTGMTTRLAKALGDLGMRELVLACATGGIKPGLCPGKVVRVSRLIDMNDAGAWRKWAWEGGKPVSEEIPPTPLAKALANGMSGAGLRLEETTLAQMPGPAYETKAEIRMLGSLGAGVVGMSSGHEWRAAKAAGLDTQILALVTNWACGVGAWKIDHGSVLQESMRYGNTLRAALTGQFPGK